MNLENVFIVLGSFDNDQYSINKNPSWIVKGFYSLAKAQKFIDRLSLDLLDSHDYMNIEAAQVCDELVTEENTKMIDRFITKYGHNVFGGAVIMLNGDKPSYTVERIGFEDEAEQVEAESITKRFRRNKNG